MPPRRSINAILMPASLHLKDVEANHLRIVNSLIGKIGATVPPRVEEGKWLVCGGSKARPRLVEARATVPSRRPFHAPQILADSGKRSSIASGASGASSVLATSVVVRRGAIATLRRCPSMEGRLVNTRLPRSSRTALAVATNVSTVCGAIGPTTGIAPPLAELATRNVTAP